MNTDIFNCEMYLCENRKTHNVTLEESCDGGVFNGPYAAALKRDLLVCYDCDDQLTMTPPPDRRQWIRNSAKSLETVNERICKAGHKFEYAYDLNYDASGNVASLADQYRCARCGAINTVE